MKNAIDRYKEAQLGMFYHFGLYTLLGTNENEIRKKVSKAEYRKLMDKFEMPDFNADEWVACAASMGAKYIVPTSRHAEGFCLWDSKLTKYKSTNTPFGRDLIAELSEACRKAGVKFAFYFNLQTWLNEGNDIWNEKGMSYADFIEGQLTELLTNYGPVTLIWFDHKETELIPYKRLQQIHKTIKTLQPDCLVDNRGVEKSDPPIGDFNTQERTFPEHDRSRDIVVECCDAMGVRSWGYDLTGAFWSVPELAKRVSICASEGYNYLLNVEPGPDGAIRPECVERAKLLGDWIRANQAPVKAVPCTIKPKDYNILSHPEIGVTTISGTNLNVFLHQWPVSDEILLPVKGELADDSMNGGECEEGIIVKGLSAIPAKGHAPWVINVPFKSAPEPLNLNVKKVTEPDSAGNVFLSPLDAACESENGILRMSLNKFPDGNVSMGSLHHINDKLIWNVNMCADCEFEVEASLGSIKCQDDAGFEITAGDSKLTARSWLTEHYSKPERRSIGKLKLSSGENRVVLRVTDFSNSSFSDLFGLWLTPAVNS